MPGFLSRAIDSAVAAIAPTWGLSRAAARAKLARAQLLAGYAAARQDRARSPGRVGSADHDLLRDLAAMRDKSRQLCRDDAHASAAVQVKVANVIGQGMALQADVHAEEAGLTEQQAADFNGGAEEVWRLWTEDQCDANEVADFHELTRQVYRTRLLDGEAFVHRVAIPGRPIATAWELVDADRVDESWIDSKREVRGGVELGSRGEPLAYWVKPWHDDDLWARRTGRTNTPIRIARMKGGVPNMLHVFRRLRAGQTRGEPMIVPALPLFEHLHHYLDSEIIAARVNANFAVFVERPIDPATDPNIRSEVDGGYDFGGGGNYQRWHEDVEPGTIEYLNQGEKIASFGHNRPGTTFDPFVQRVLRAIAASLDMPFELILKEFGGMNYSSARTALLEARRGFEVERSTIVAQWLRPVYQTVIREAIQAGLLPQFRSQGADIRPFLRSRFIPPAWGWVDPVKEVESARLAIEANLSTPDREAARAGMDIEEILLSKARALVLAREIEEKHGLKPGALMGGSSAPAPAPPPEPQEPESPEDPDDEAPDPADDEGVEDVPEDDNSEEPTE